VVRSGTQLTLNGQPFRFTGLNIYNAANISDCWYQMGTGAGLDTALTNIGAGQTVFRTWFFQHLATTNGQRDWTGFDHALAVARAHGERVIVTLGNEWGDCEEANPGYKTESWYQVGYQNRLDASVPNSYRGFVAEVVNRYRSDPTVLMWQLMNEAEDPIAKGAPCSKTATQNLTRWATDMGAMVKQIDPDHLLSLGTIGTGECGTLGPDYQTVHAVQAIDICEFHDYYEPTHPMPAVDQANSLQTRINECRQLNKPIMVAETGIETAQVGSVQNRAADFNAKFQAQFQAGVVGELIWAWDNSGSSTTSWYVGSGDPVLALFGSY
jgi:endo-1,4-beta-mannosidase